MKINMNFLWKPVRCISSGNGRKGLRPSMVAVCFFALALSAQAFTSLPFYDDFGYADETPLAGQNGWSVFSERPSVGGILPVQYHGWVGYPGGTALASNSLVRLTGKSLLNQFGTYTRQPGIGGSSSSGQYDKETLVTIRYVLDLSDASAPDQEIREESRFGDIFWHSGRYHYENPASFYSIMPVVRYFVKTNGLVSAYNGHLVRHLTHTPITEPTPMTVVVDYLNFKWSLWAGNELVVNNFGLYKFWRGSSVSDYTHMQHDGWYKDYDGFKEVGFIDGTEGGVTVLDRVRVFPGLPTARAMPMIENFETRTMYGEEIIMQLGSLNGQNGWFATGASVATAAQNSEIVAGIQGAQINAGGEAFQLFLDGQTNVWTDLWMLPIAVGSGSANVDAGGGHAVFYVNDAGEVHAYDGASTTNVWSVNAGEWSRFTIQSDYGDNTWDLYVGGVQKASGLAFRGDGYGNTYEELRFSSSDSGTNTIMDWAHRVPAGIMQQGAPITSTIANLTYGVEYRYRLFGENAEGSGWSGVETFLSDIPRDGEIILVGIAGADATDVTQTNATLQGVLDSPRATFTAHVYWSKNNLVTPAEWTAPGAADTVEIGTYEDVVGQGLSHPVSDLDFNTTYYYTFRIENPATNIWAAESVSFTTQGAPAVTNIGARNVSAGITELRGELLDGVQADAYLVWDTEDRGTAATNDWPNMLLVSGVTESEPFGAMATGLVYGVQYAYRVYVENAFGHDWSDEYTFWTLPPVDPEPLASGGVATNLYTDAQGKLWYAHVFTGNGNFVVADDLDVEYMIVAGGGGGGGVRDNHGNAGGGGGGGHPGLTSGRSGGSGGGGATSNGSGGAGTSGQGYIGGMAGSTTASSGGGGGGAGGAGSLPAGGTGVTLDFVNGIDATYATGGKGGVYDETTTLAGEPNTGDGGGGGSHRNSRVGAAGGSGIVVVRYEVVPGVGLAVRNTTVTNVAATTVDIVGELDAFGAVMDVTAYWSTTDHPDATAWLADGSAQNAPVGTYTNVVGQELILPLSGLTQGTTYYYTFMATNALTNIWASPNREFGTKGAPSVTTATGATNETYGAVTLQGLLTAGGEADAYIVWDTADRLNTSTSDWAHVESVGSQLQGVVFGQVVTGLLYGVEYSYRVYVENEYDPSAWSDVATFKSSIPESDGHPLVAVRNGEVSGIGATFATIHGELDATQSVFTVTAYWSTTDHGSLEGWQTASSASLGSFTNVSGEALSLPITELDQETRYFYTFVASNVSTNLLATPNAYFYTQGGTAVDTAGGATAIGSGTAGLRGELTSGGVADATFVWGVLDPGPDSTNGWDQVGVFGEVAQGSVFTNMVSNLLYGVEYYYRVYVTNAIDDSWSTTTNFTTALPEGVNIAPSPVANVGVTTAELQGVLNATQSVFSVYAFWSTNNNASAEAWTNDTSKGTALVGTYTNVVGESLTVPVESLETVTTYYYTFMASNVVGELWATENASFSTVDQPAVSGTGATSTGVGAVSLGGTLTAGFFADATLVWGTEDPGTDSTNSWDHVVSVGVVTQDIAFASQLTNLLYGVEYHYRVYVTNEAGSAWSDPAVTFLTQAPAISIANTSAANILTTSADLQGTLDAPGAVFAVTAYWSTNNNADATAWAADLDKDSAPVGTFTNVVDQPLTVEATGLIGNTTYYYTLVATNAATNVWAENVSFKTLPPASEPAVSAFAATDVGPYSATLHGLLTAGGAADAYFVWGPADAGTGSTGDWAYVSSSTVVIEDAGFSLSLSDLLPGTDYAYRVFVTNSEGSAWSDPVELFTTWQPRELDRSGSGDWDTTSDVWSTVSDGPYNDVAWTNINLDTAVFEGDTGTITLTEEITVGGVKFNSGRTITGETLTLASGTSLEANVGTGNDTPANIESVLAGNNGFTKTGTGWLRLGATSSDLSGDIQIQSGTLITRHEALGSGNIIFTGNAALRKIHSANSDFPETMGIAINPGVTATLNPPSFPHNANHAGVLAGETNAVLVLSLGGNTELQFNNTANTFQGQLTITGAGTGDGNYRGVFRSLADGNARLQINNALFRLANGGVSMHFANRTVEMLNNARIDNASTNPDVTITIAQNLIATLGNNSRTLLLTGGNTGDNTFAGAIGDSATGSGTVSVTKEGNGKWILSGTNTYSGTTTVSAGTLSIENNRAFPAASTLVISDGAVNLADGIIVQVSALTLDGDAQASGVYGSMDSAAPNKSAFFTGSGLLYVGVAPPAVHSLSASNVTLATADLQGVLDTEVDEVTVTAYWSTNDHTTLDAWLADGSAGSAPGDTFDSVLGQDLSVEATSLTEGTTYYYTFAASNENITVWASPNASFTTIAPEAPVVDVAGGATNIVVGAVDLQGVVTTINGTLEDVRIYFGREDGGTTPGNWATNFVLDVSDIAEGVPFATNVTELLYGIEYNYRVYATNTFGSAWSTAVTNILTLAPAELAIVNTAAANIGTTIADLQGTLDATQSVFTVTAYWSTTSNATAQAWIDDTTKGSAQVGSFTNVVSRPLSVAASGLVEGTTYFYTFVATNAATNIWATPNASFKTAGTPVVSVGAGADPIGVATATLNGVLTEGGAANTHIVWGTSDAGTNSIHEWDHQISMGEVLQDVAFSTNLTGLLYGQPYYYRVFAENDAGSDWSAGVSFLTDAALGSVTLAPISGVTGYRNSIDSGHNRLNRTIDGTGMDLDEPDDPSTWRATSNAWSDEWQATPLLDSATSISNKIGWISWDLGSTNDKLKELYLWNLREATGQNRRIVTYHIHYASSPAVTLPSQSDVLNTSVDYDFGSDGWNLLTTSGPLTLSQAASTPAPADAVVSLENVSARYIALEILTNGGGDRVGMAEVGITKAVPQYSIAVTYATNVTATIADLQGILHAPESIFDATVYWSTNNHETLAAWQSDGDRGSAAVGTYVDATGQNISAQATGLRAGTTYYYTLVATNAAETIWAGSNASFETIEGLDMVSLSPGHGVGNVSIAVAPRITFVDPIQKGTGTIEIWLAGNDDTPEQTIDVASAQVSISDETVTISLSEHLAYSSTYSIVVPEGAFASLGGGAVSTPISKGMWEFTTRAAPGEGGGAVYRFR